MKPTAFAYHRASSVDETVRLLREHPEAKIIAGGQSLVPMMNFRLSRPPELIDIMGIPGLSSVEMRGEMLYIGGLLRHQQLSEDQTVKRVCPVLAEAAGHVGHWAIRNRGTLSGSLAHADPASELPAAVVALDATMLIAAVEGVRKVPARDFYKGFFTTDLLADELLIGIEIPVDSKAHFGFAEIARRPGDFALAGAFVEYNENAEGAVTWFGISGGPERRSAMIPDDSVKRQALWHELLTTVDVLEEDAYRLHAAEAVAEQAYKHAVGGNNL